MKNFLGFLLTLSLIVTSASSQDFNWELIGGGGINGSWLDEPDFERNNIFASTEWNGKLYIALGQENTNKAEVWSWDGSAWLQEGGDGINSSWDAGFSVVDLAVYQDNLYAAVDGDFSGGIFGCQLWAFDGIHWNLEMSPSIDPMWEGRPSSLVVSSTDLYVALQGYYGWVWKFDGVSWEKIAGDDINDSWHSGVTVDLETYMGDVYVSIQLVHNPWFLAGSSAWKWNGVSWEMIGGNEINNSWESDPDSSFPRKFVVHNGNLVLSVYVISDTDSRTAGVWSWDGTLWELIGGDGLNGSWDLDAGMVSDYVNDVHSFNSKLYVAFAGWSGNWSGGAWEFDGLSWRKTGGDGLNCLWAVPDQYGQHGHVTDYAGDLYFGNSSRWSLGISSPQVWRYTEGYECPEDCDPLDLPEVENLKLLKWSGPHVAFTWDAVPGVETYELLRNYSVPFDLESADSMGLHDPDGILVIDEALPGSGSWLQFYQVVPTCY